MTLHFDELVFDSGGQPLFPGQLDDLMVNSIGLGVTDLIFFAHGFRCNASDATALYTRLLETLSPHLACMQDRQFGIAGIYWPSKEFPESLGTAQSVRGNFSVLRSLAGGDAGLDLIHAQCLLPRLPGNRGAQNDFVSTVLTAFDDGGEDPTEGLPLLHEFLDSPNGGAELLDRLRVPVTEPRTNVESLLGGVDMFLNFMTWARMKRLAGAVGEIGLASYILACQRRLPSVRIHLVGHSLGGRLMAACCKSLARLGGRPVDSLSLLEAAFSHFGFSPDAGWRQPGFFREVISGKAVSGAIISTFSKRDKVVGLAYAAASRLAHDNLQAIIGDATDPYGGIGHNGAQLTPESTAQALHEAGQQYDLPSGIVTCLDGSAGLIAGHDDVTNTHVTYAIASAIGAAN